MTIVSLSIAANWPYYVGFGVLAVVILILLFICIRCNENK